MALPAEYAWVKDLIDEEGRAFTITVPGAVADSGKPWRGNAAGTPVGATGVFVRYKASQIDGDQIKRGDQKLLLYPSDTLDIEDGTKIVDSLDSSVWHVEDIKKITSKSDIILYILQMRR
jgi:hypothetical protein